MQVIVAAVLPTTVLIFTVIVILFLRWRRLICNTADNSTLIEMSTGCQNKYESIDNWLTEWPDYGKLQFDRTKLEILGDLGEGEFGKVHLAVAHCILPNEPETKVAVKTLKGGSSKETALEFRNELEIMMMFDHPNIVRLLGVCTQEEPLYLITELMTKASHFNARRTYRARPYNCIVRLVFIRVI